jgi:hypothetical protein
MHESVMAWVERKVVELSLQCKPTLEIGSYDVNGSVRGFFHGEYTGVDLVAGPGVDVVVRSGEPLPFPDNSFEVVVTTEMLEHDPRPWVTMHEIARVLEVSRGTLILTCRGFDEKRGSFPFHNPPDHYRFSAGALAVLAEDAALRVVDVDADPQVPGWFMIARAPAEKS